MLSAAAVFTIGGGMLTSCVDTVIFPDNKTLDVDYWKKKSEVESLVAQAYAQLRDGGTAATAVSFQRNAIVWSGLRSDELLLSADFKTNSTLLEELTQIYSMQIQTDNSFTKWTPFYSSINYCNLVLEKGQDVMNYDPDYTEGDWLANKAQVTALKAFCYFYLVRVFRDVPVTPHAYLNSSDDLQVEQSAPADVLQMCIDDLESVVNDAPAGNAYTSTVENKCYFNRDGINALLADIYLWRASVNHDVSDYQKAVECCDRVIAAKKSQHVSFGFNAGLDNSDYYLSPAKEMYDDLFGGQGNYAEESIFYIPYYTNAITNNALMNMYYGWKDRNSGYGYLKATTVYGDYNQSASSPNLFKNNKDQRLYEFCYNANEGGSQHGVRKYVAGQSSGIGVVEQYKTDLQNFTRDWIIYRLTDVMLMKAEALVQLGQEREAFNLVKVVNDRAIDNDATVMLNWSTYQDKMERLVLMERGRELCFEGKRWFDLMRYNYRHVEGTDYSKKLSELAGNYVPLSDEFYELVLNKYTAQSAMKAKMPSEPYLYMPINQDETELNTSLVQNPVYKPKR